MSAPINNSNLLRTQSFSGAQAVNASILDTKETVSGLALAPKNDFKHSVFFNIITLGIGYAIMQALDSRDERRVGELKEGVKDLYSKLNTAIANKGVFGRNVDGTDIMTCTVSLADRENVSLRFTQEGKIYARLAEGEAEYELDATAEQLRLKLAEDMFAHADVFSRAELRNLVADSVPRDRQTEARDKTAMEDSFHRRIYMLAIMSNSDIDAHRLENLTTANLQDVAFQSLNDGGTREEINVVLSGQLDEIDKAIDANRFTTFEADALVGAYRSQPESAQQKVVVNPSVVAPKKDEKELVPQDLRDLAADFLIVSGKINCNENLSKLGKKKELANVMLQHVDVISRLIVSRGKVDDKNSLAYILENMPDDDSLHDVLAEMNNKLTDAGFGDKLKLILGLDDSKLGSEDDVKDALRTKLGNYISQDERQRAGFAAVFQAFGNLSNSLMDNAMEEFYKIATEDVANTIKNAVENVTNQVKDALGHRDSGSDANQDAVVVAPQVQANNSQGDGVTIEQLMAEVENDSNKGSRKFFKDVIRRYVEESAPIDQYNMVAAAIRYGRSYGKQDIELSHGRNQSQNLQTIRKQEEVVAFLKGAGPLLHKLLQGAPTGVLDGYDNILKAVKKNLAPIPEEFVKAYLMDIKLRSGGKITEIEAVKNLGAASVGEALLCRVKGPGYPQEGKEVVVKMLRPDALVRIQREKELMLKIAEDSHMRETYAGQLDTILKEFDFTSEADNIVLGEIYDKGSSRVKAVKCESIVAATPSVLVMEKAEGKTASDILEDVDALLNRQPYDEQVKDEYAAELQTKYSELLTMQKDLAAMTKQWVTEAIFGAGVFHGDLHAGNIMLDPKKGLTLIDFGNVTKLTAEQQTQITRMVAAACAGGDKGAEIFEQGLKILLGMQVEDSWKVGENDFSQAVKAMIAQALNAGNQDDTGKRIFVILSKLENMGIKVPEPIFKFSQSQMRLQNTIDSINAKLRLLQLKMYQHGERVVGETSGTGTENDFFNSVKYLLREFGNSGDAYDQGKGFETKYNRRIATLKTPIGDQHSEDEVKQIDSYVTDTELNADRQKLPKYYKMLEDLGVKSGDIEEFTAALADYSARKKQLKKADDDLVEAQQPKQDNEVTAAIGEFREEFTGQIIDTLVGEGDDDFKDACWTILNKVDEMMKQCATEQDFVGSMEREYGKYDNDNDNDSRTPMGYAWGVVKSIVEGKSNEALRSAYLKVFTAKNKNNANQIEQLTQAQGAAKAEMTSSFRKVRELRNKLELQAATAVYAKYIKPTLKTSAKNAKPADFFSLMSQVVLQNVATTLKRVDASIVKIMG